MKLAVVGHHVAPIAPPFVGGVESHTFYLARWLADRGHDVTLFALAGSAVPGVDVRPIGPIPAPSAAARRDVSMPPETFMAAHHAYQRLTIDLMAGVDEFDAIHLQTLHYLPAAMAALLPAPALLTLHTPPTPWLESALRSASRPPVLNAVSEATAAAWAPLSIDHVIPNGVATDAWPLGRGGPDAAWCGRLVEEKAPHLAIDAARAAGLRLRLAGPILDHGYWERDVLPRLGRDAEYVGHLDHVALARLLGESCVALMTPVWDEPFGLAAAEAMATGTPVAAFARGGLPAVIGNLGGRIAAGGDVAGLAAAAREAAGLDRAAVRRSALARLGLDAMGRGYEQILQGLVERRADAAQFA